MDQHDLTLHDRVQRSYRLRQNHYLRRTNPIGARGTTMLAPNRGFLPLRLCQTPALGMSALPRGGRFLLRLMLEKGEEPRVPPPASDHPLSPRGYV